MLLSTRVNCFKQLETLMTNFIFFGHPRMNNPKIVKLFGSVWFDSVNSPGRFSPAISSFLYKVFFLIANEIK